jgi:hypothetical protein
LKKGEKYEPINAKEIIGGQRILGRPIEGSKITANVGF